MIYDEKTVRVYLSGIWDPDVAIHGVYQETERDPSMPKGSTPDPSQGNGTVALIADLKRAYERAELTDVQRAVLFLRSLEWTYAEVGYCLGMTRQTASLEEERALNEMVAFLNGKRVAA